MLLCPSSSSIPCCRRMYPISTVGTSLLKKLMNPSPSSPQWKIWACYCCDHKAIEQIEEQEKGRGRNVFCFHFAPPENQEEVEAAEGVVVGQWSCANVQLIDCTRRSRSNGGEVC